jgi:hypothetical protein
MTSDIDRLRTLMDLAQQGGADAEWLAETADKLVAALLELEELRRGAGDPRPRRKLMLIGRVGRAYAAMLAAGHGESQAVDSLADRFGREPKTIRGYIHKFRGLQTDFKQSDSPVGPRHRTNVP